MILFLRKEGFIPADGLRIWFLKLGKPWLQETEAGGHIVSWVEAESEEF